MKLVLKFLACTVLVFFVVREARYLFASDEDRIQMCVEDMVSGFNAARLSSASAGIHSTWLVPDVGVTRPYLQDGLRSLFFQEKHPETRAFALSAEVDEDSWEISVEEATATATFVLRFHRLDTEPPTLEWEVRLDNRLIDDPKQGWCLVETRYESLTGARLGTRR
jgi:hypothetical protein